MTDKLDELRARLERYKALRVIEPAGTGGEGQAPLERGPYHAQGATLKRAPSYFGATHRGPVSIALTAVALTLFASAVAATAAYAWTLGASEFARSVFCAIGVVADCLVFLLPLAASRSPLPIALCAWSAWSVALAFALSGAIGFAALNIADVTSARAARTSPAIELAQRKLNAATAAVQAECRRVGPLCHARQAEQRQALADLAVAQAAVEAGADPQVAKAAQLVAWLTPWRPSSDDLAMVRLALLTLLPQLGGLVLLVARR
jgi:hypothetical protein